MLAVEPEFIEVTPDMRTKLDRFAEEHDGEPLGGVGGRVIYDDDKVRIWELVLKPGDESDFHHHENDYYLIIFEGDLVAGVPPKGSGVDPFVAKIPEEGNIVLIPGRGPEWAYNVGEKTYREIIVEYKKN